MMGPAERADVVVDFSQVPDGSKIILYNDAPAPVPAFDPRYDYYTGDPDQTDTGGAPTTLAGYGPNTRTIMQFQVGSPTAAAPFNLAQLQTAVVAAYGASQDKPIAPQKVYGPPFGATITTDTYVPITDTTVTIPASPLSTTSTVQMGMQPKAIQELFELDYGRMNATLGVELPFTNSNKQTTIPYFYIDPITEKVTDSNPGALIGTLQDGTQIWKITHNGVDTHAIHFHLFNVQVINRVGWDGAIALPDANEVGWKDTVRMNPLEDVIIALRPVVPTLPFKLPDSVRPLDVTKPLGSTMGFSNVGPDGNPTTTVNVMTNNGWEYVWHCHLLGHEENDMMRPIKFQVAPPTPINLAASRAILNGRPAGATLSWGLSAPTPVATTFRIQECADPNFNGVISEFSVPGTNLSYLDLPIRATAYYRIRSENDVSFSPWSASVGVTALPSNWPVGVNAIRATSAIPGQAVVSWALPGNANATSYRVEYSNTGPGGPWLAGPTVGPTATSSNVLRLRSLMTYWFRVIAINSAGSTASNASTAQIR
jgi:FtsP/CotA-like multicopper oxidase with cupredoxin domain